MFEAEVELLQFLTLNLCDWGSPKDDLLNRPNV